MFSAGFGSTDGAVPPAFDGFTSYDAVQVIAGAIYVLVGLGVTLVFGVFYGLAKGILITFVLGLLERRKAMTIYRIRTP